MWPGGSDRDRDRRAVRDSSVMKRPGPRRSSSTVSESRLEPDSDSCVTRTHGSESDSLLETVVMPGPDGSAVM